MILASDSKILASENVSNFYSDSLEPRLVSVLKILVKVGSLFSLLKGEKKCFLRWKKKQVTSIDQTDNKIWVNTYCLYCPIWFLLICLVKLIVNDQLSTVLCKCNAKKRSLD